MQARIGMKIYRVESYGSLHEYEIIDFKDNNPVYSVRGLTDLSNQEYKLKSKSKPFARSNFSLDIAINNPDEFYFDLETAKTKSLERFEKEVNPNGLYRVARYFDDVFECFVTEAMNKKDAQKKCNQFNNIPRAYVYFDIKSVNQL